MRSSGLIRPLFAVLLVCAALAEATDTVRASSLTVVVGSVETRPGAVVVVPIRVQSAQHLGAVQFELSYDDAVLEFQALEAGSFPQECTTGSNVLSSGRLRVVLNTPPAESINGDGDLLRVRFAVKDGARSESPLQLESVRAWDNVKPDAVPYEMLVTSQSGIVAVAPPTKDFWMWGGVALIAVLLLAALRRALGRPRSAA